jgi:hypothetical protein
MEIIETGGLRRVDAERTEDVAVVQLFEGIYGVGESVFDLVPYCAYCICSLRTIDRIQLVFCGMPHS